MSSQPPALFQPRAQLLLDPPEDFSAREVSLADLQELERTLIPHPRARWTIPQRLFFEALLASPSMDPDEAVRRSGVKRAQANRWLAKPETREVLHHLMRKRCEQTGITPLKTMNYIHTGLRMALGDLPIVKTFVHQGRLYSEQTRETDLGAAARFLDMMAKHSGAYQQDEPDLHGGVHINLQLGDATVSAKDIRKAALNHDPDE